MCHKNKASIIPVIIHPNFILSKKIISLLLKECNMVAQFIPLLSKAKNINDFLDIIKNNEALFEKYGDENYNNPEKSEEIKSTWMKKCVKGKKMIILVYYYKIC